MKNYITLFLLLFALGTSTGQAEIRADDVINLSISESDLVTLGGSYTTAESIPFEAIADWPHITRAELVAPCAPGRGDIIAYAIEELQSYPRYTLADYPVTWPDRYDRSSQQPKITIDAPPPGYTVEVRYVKLE